MFLVRKIFLKKLFCKFSNRGFVLSRFRKNQHNYISIFWYRCTEKCLVLATIPFSTHSDDGNVVKNTPELVFSDFRAKNWGFFASKESLELVGKFSQCRAGQN